jgi:hypothetical protein
VQAAAKLQSFGTSFLDAFEVMHVAGERAAHIQPRRLTITMITFVASLSKPLSPAMLRDVAARIETGKSDLFRLAGNQPLVTGAKSIMLRDSLTCSTTQIFHSGKIQFGGCASQIEMAGLLQEVLVLLDDPEVLIDDFQTHLVNLNVGLGKRVRIGQTVVESLNDSLAPLNNRRCAEKRENYAPVTIVLPCHTSDTKAVTCQLFASGSLQCSAPTIADLVTAYTFVIDFLEQHASEVLVDFTDKDLEDDRTKNSRCWSELARQACPGLVHTHLPVRHVVEGCVYCKLFGNVFASPSI